MGSQTHGIRWEPEYDKRRWRNQNAMRGDVELEYNERRWRNQNVRTGERRGRNENVMILIC